MKASGESRGRTTRGRAKTRFAAERGRGDEEEGGCSVGDEPDTRRVLIAAGSCHLDAHRELQGPEETAGEPLVGGRRAEEPRQDPQGDPDDHRERETVDLRVQRHLPGRDRGEQRPVERGDGLYQWQIARWRTARSAARYWSATCPRFRPRHAVTPSRLTKVATRRSWIPGRDRTLAQRPTAGLGDGPDATASAISGRSAAPAGAPAAALPRTEHLEAEADDEEPHPAVDLPGRGR